ncbi:glycosyltransferase [Oceanobacillus arenosus]|nr:glycosyltransferase [Oceanobacillus arenosus]
MSKGTIIYIGGFELPDKNAAAHRVMSNAKLLRKLGYSIVFIGIDKDINTSKNIINTRQEIEGFTSYQVPYPRSNKQWFNHLVSIDHFLKVVEMYNNIEAVICYNYQSLAFEKIRKYCRKNKIKIISDCTEWYGKSEGNIAFRILKYFDTALRMKIINNRVDSLIVVSKYLRNYYKNKPAIVIPTIVSRKKQSKSKYIENEVTKLIYAGVPFRLGKRLKKRNSAKDRLDIAIKLLYQSYKKGIKFRFDIYGITKKQYIEVLPEDTFIIEKMENYIFFHGRRTNREVQNIISNADFSILIRDENRTTMAGFPTKFAESISLGVPVITTKTSDLVDYLVEGKNGFFIDIKKENRDEDIFFKILSIDKESKREMKEYCLKEKTFDPENWIDDFRYIL